MNLFNKRLIESVSSITTVDFSTAISQHDLLGTPPARLRSRVHFRERAPPPVFALLTLNQRNDTPHPERQLIVVFYRVVK